VTATVTLRASASAGMRAEVERRIGNFAVTCRIVEQHPGDD
jgi:fatty-acyl-CoA synthase